MLPFDGAVKRKLDSLRGNLWGHGLVVMDDCEESACLLRVGGLLLYSQGDSSIRQKRVRVRLAGTYQHSTLYLTPHDRESLLSLHKLFARSQSQTQIPLE